MATDVNTHETPKGGARARVVAAAALLAFASAIGYAGHEGYRAATDSFVAPIILSPDNDVVLANKAKLGELTVERARIVAEVQDAEADLAAGDKALARLRALDLVASNALAWTEDVTARQAAATAVELKTLHRKRELLAAMASKQERIARDATDNLGASLISKTDLTREELALNQVQIAMLDNESARVQSEVEMRGLSLAQRSLARRSGAPLMPEALGREEQMVRLELEILRLESEQRTKQVQRGLLVDKLAKMDELEQQLRARPLFRATERSMDVAFVPYTQLAGVARGADVYDCVWGIFRCKPVGKIAEIVPGEVILPDPWGNPARGQYAVLDLQQHESAKAKVLRVRGPGLPAQENEPPPSTVSVR